MQKGDKYGHMNQVDVVGPLRGLGGATVGPGNGAK